MLCSYDVISRPITSCTDRQIAIHSSFLPHLLFVTGHSQNCRLAIWNLQSGKNVRTYKTDAVKGELYKSDTDPSGIELFLPV